MADLTGSAIGFKMTFEVVGGLGIFLLGMKNMSEGMQAVAGDKLRKMINAVTNNRLMACGMGTLVTCLIQSSSVTTVMVVGMVSASLMTLMQAIGVIIGANIGTTITGWILVLNIGKYGLPILGICALFYLFTKSDRVRFTAALFMGLGMIFYGMELMKNGFSPLSDMPAFLSWFSRFQPDSYFGVLKCCMVGAILTAIVQSSSATIGITMSLALTGVITYPTAAALVLGENIGTTITAYLASLGASTNAKRASYAHILVNVIGVIWITAVFGLYTNLILKMIGVSSAEQLEPGSNLILSAIAATHTGFNVVNAIIWLPLISVLHALLIRIVPDKSHEEKPHLKYIDVRMVDTPSIGIEQSRKEVIWMGEQTHKMFAWLRSVLTSPVSDKDLEEKIFKREHILDVVQKEVVEFLSNILSGNLSHDIAIEGRQQLRTADEYESISDYVTTIMKLLLKMRKTNQVLTEDALNDILELHDIVAAYIEYVNGAVKNDGIDFFNKAKMRGKGVTHLMKELRAKHLARIEDGSATPLKSLIYMDILNAYRKIKDHAFNIAEIVAGEK